MGLVYDAGSIASLAAVDQSPPDGPLEEAGASVTGQDAVMFARAGISAHTADQSSSSSLNKRKMTALWPPVPPLSLSSPSVPGQSGASLRSE